MQGASSWYHRRVRGDGVIPGIALAITWLSLSGCIGGVCSHRGCASIERLVFSVPRNLDEPMVAKVCRNEVCVEARLEPSLLQATGEVEVEVDYDGPSALDPSSLRCTVRAAAERATCRLGWTLIGPERIESGDELSVQLSMDGTELSHRSGQVGSIVSVYPDGEDCGVGCQEATVDVG